MRLLLSVLLISTLIACTKKREESFVQGQGKDLLTISDYDGAEFDVETLGPVAGYTENPAVSKSEVVTRSKDLKVLSDKKAASQSNVAKTEEKKSSEDKTNFEVPTNVKVDTKAKLLSDAPFIAYPNRKTGYKIRYMLTKDFLVVLKVAHKSLIHQQEVAGAMVLDAEKEIIGVPVVGYPVKGFYNAENVEQNGERTNKLTEMSVDSKEGAQYFKIDKNGRTLYKLQEKMDLFEKVYFSGPKGEDEWYFAQTIIAAGGRNSDYSGWVLAQQDAELNALSKVKFVFNRSELRAVSVNLDKRLKEKNDEIYETVLVKLPIEWKEYRPTPSGKSGFTMVEEENTSVDWEKRKNVKIDFSRASTISIQSPKFRFVDLEVDTDYFSFTLYEPEANLRIKQSFMRDKNRLKYTPKRMLKEDFEKFGFFDTQKHEVDNFEKYRQEDYGKNIFINRFNVAQKKIVFYFTEGSDEKLIPYAAQAAKEWSEAFKAAGVDLEIVAETDPDKRAKLGDIRFNQINLIKSTNETNLFGYGPSITDPTTGEIISATTNMHITSIVSALASHIRDYLLYKGGVTKTLSVYTGPAVLPDAVAIKGDSVVVRTEAGTPQLPIRFPVMGLNGQVEMKKISLPEKDARQMKLRKKNWGREFDIGITGKNLNQEIEKRCPKVLSLAADLEKGQRSEKENEIVIECAEKIVPYKMFGTLLHEMGHNFGLRHNFYGSVDAVNFLSKEKTGTEEQVNSSSVMEYPSFGEDRLTKVGLYDIAAIRYGYGDAVETTNGQIVKLDTNKTIAENLQVKGLTQKPYLFCTDEDVEVGTDPMCARHDAGTTPDKIVSSIIAEYNATISEYNYRLGRQRTVDPNSLTMYRIRRFWIPMKKYYDEWRYKLADHLGVGHEYLDTMDKVRLQTEIDKKIDACKASKQIDSEACRFAQYKAAADKVFHFTMQIATLPPKYCVGSRNGNLAMVEFADVRSIVMKVNKFVPESCLDKQVVAYIEKEENGGFTPVLETGYELEDVRLDMKVKMSRTKTDWFGNPLPEPPDIIGLMPEKMIAVEILAVRAGLSMSSADKKFLPNLLDEPIYREATLAYLADRLSKGLNSQRLLANKDLQALTKQNVKIGPEIFVEKFKYERKYIDNLVSSVIWGLDVPDKLSASKQRKKKFMVKYTDKKDILDKAKFKVAGLDGTTYYAIMNNEATEARKLLEILETLPKRLEAASPVNEETFLALQENAKNILEVDNQKVEIGQFLDFAYSIIEDEFPALAGVARTKEEQDVDKYRVHWKKAFQKEASAIRDMFTGFNSDPSERGDPAAALAGFKSDILQYVEFREKKNYDIENTTFKNYKKAVGLLFDDPNYQLNQNVVNQRIGEYKKATEQAAKTEKNEDAYNYAELKTQQEMILGVLRSMTEY